MADLDDHEEDDSNMSNVVERDRGGSDSGAGATSVLPVGVHKKQRKVLEFRAKMESEKIATTEVLKLRGWLKAVAYWNIWFISVTLEVLLNLIGWLKALAPLNILLILVTLEVFSSSSGNELSFDALANIPLIFVNLTLPQFKTAVR